MDSTTPKRGFSQLTPWLDAPQMNIRGGGSQKVVLMASDYSLALISETTVCIDRQACELDCFQVITPPEISRSTVGTVTVLVTPIKVV
jgi:hypothetical protein